MPQLTGYVARFVQPIHASKEYLCPSCANPIRRREGHVVVWPEHAEEFRRHWHRHCWRLAVSRGRIP